MFQERLGFEGHKGYHKPKTDLPQKGTESSFKGETEMAEPGAVFPEMADNARGHERHNNEMQNNYKTKYNNSDEDC